MNVVKVTMQKKKMIMQLIRPNYIAKIQEYNNQIISFMAIVVFIMLLFDLYQCTTLTKIDKTDLPALKEAEYIWLPVKEKKKKIHCVLN